MCTHIYIYIYAHYMCVYLSEHGGVCVSVCVSQHEFDVNTCIYIYIYNRNVM